MRSSGLLAAGLVAVAAACAAPRPAVVPARLAPIERQVIVAVIDTVAAHLPDSTTLCISIMGGPSGPTSPDDLLLTHLHTRQRPERHSSCPPTYESMMILVDSAGRPRNPPRPAGYIDPYLLSISRPQFEYRDYAWVFVRQRQGTAGQEYICSVQAYRGSVVAHCVAGRSWLS
jgi:hypothetical protein